MASDRWCDCCSPAEPPTSAYDDRVRCTCDVCHRRYWGATWGAAVCHSPECMELWDAEAAKDECYAEVR